ncbi:MAG: hypothetical protein WBC86_15675, partial [Pseudolabrys sp.]
HHVGHVGFRLLWCCEPARRAPKDKLLAACNNMAMRHYPSDLQDGAVQIVLQQAEVLSAEWAA